MALRDIHESVMLRIARTFADPQGLRPVLEGNERLKIFAADFEAVEKVLRAAQDYLGSAEHRSLQEEMDTLRTNEAAIEKRHDYNIRSTHFVLEAAKVSESPELVRAAEILQPKLLPNGRSLVRYTISRKVGDAWGTAERLDPPDVDLMKAIGAPSGTVADLHQNRLDIVAELDTVSSQLYRLEARERDKGIAVSVARSQWFRLARNFLANVSFAELDPETERLLTGEIERASELETIRRARLAARSDEANSQSSSTAGAATSSSEGSSSAPATSNPAPGANDLTAPASDDTPQAGSSSVA